MARKVFGCVMIVTAIACVAPVARAGDRKSASHEQESIIDTVAAREARSPFQRQDGLATASSRAMQVRYDSPAVTPASPRSAGGASETAVPEHKQLTLFHINSPVGQVAVQPVLSGVKGAQFSIGF